VPRRHQGDSQNIATAGSFDVADRSSCEDNSVESSRVNLAPDRKPLADRHHEALRSQRRQYGLRESWRTEPFEVIDERPQSGWSGAFDNLPFGIDARESDRS